MTTGHDNVFENSVAEKGEIAGHPVGRGVMRCPKAIVAVSSTNGSSAKYEVDIAVMGPPMYKYGLDRITERNIYC